MEEKDKKTLKKFIEKYGSDEILDEISSVEISDYIEDHTFRSILEYISKDVIMEQLDSDDILNQLGTDELIDEIGLRGYEVILDTEDSLLGKIGMICRELSKSPSIDKEYAKKLLCEYIDTFMIRNF